MENDDEQHYVEITLVIGGIISRRTMSERQFTMLAFPRRVLQDEAAKVINDVLAMHDGKVE